MLVPMAKIRILGHKSALDATMVTLQELGVLQIEDASQERSVGLPAMTLAGDRLRELEEARLLLARLDALLAVLPPVASVEEQPQETPLSLSTLRHELEAVEPEVHRLVTEQDELRAEAAALPRYQATLSRLLPLTSRIYSFQGYETVALLIDKRYRYALTMLDEDLLDITRRRHAIVAEELDPDTVGALLVFPREVSSQVHERLGRGQITRVTLPESLQGLSLEAALAQIERRLQEIPQQLEEIDQQLAALSRRWRSRWMAARQLLQDRLDCLETVRRACETKYTFALVGWLPKRSIPELQRALAERVGDHVIAEEIPLTREELRSAPILMENPRWSKAFEFWIRFLALPRYGSLDPTQLMSLFMPVFFGMMLGDVIYGLILMALAVWAIRRFEDNPTLQAIARTLMIGAAWAVVFGLLYGEALGDLGHVLGLRPLWLAREDPGTLTSLLAMCIAVGAAHVVLGLILGIWQAWQFQSRHELLQRIGLLLGLISLFALIGVAARQLPPGLLTPATAALLVALAIVIAADWPTGLLLAPVEILGVAGNVLSYLRIAAIGLSSVYLARIGNEIGGLTGSVWLGAIIAALFHILNLALGAFSPTIHSLRLHYVEFFGKFYQEGGLPFEPFRRRRSQTP
ncbi:MAG: V-type ATP synthase subunit I [Anaerolineae bacterium]